MDLVMDLVMDLATDLVAIADSATGGSVTQDLALDNKDSDAMDLEIGNFAQKIYFFFSLFNVNFIFI
jgi:hypothetical protein